MGAGHLTSGSVAAEADNCGRRPRTAYPSLPQVGGLEATLESDWPSCDPAQEEEEGGRGLSRHQAPLPWDWPPGSCTAR